MSEIELHRKLLGDAVRNDALRAALKRVIKPGCTVADIGAGTGFIAFLARQLGAAHCHLYEYSGALELAKDLARKNRITGLTFVHAHSAEVKKPPQADVVISETLGNFALEEGLLETLVDARRFLARGGTLVPARLRQFVAPVTSSRLQDEIDVWGRVDAALDLSGAREVALSNMYVKDIRVADLAPNGARQWDEIDFSPTGKAPSSVRQGAARWSSRELAGATVYGMALWWEVELVPGVMLSTAPAAPPTHWQQVYLPLLEALQASGDERVELDLRSDTRDGVRLIWETRVMRIGKPRASQRQDLARGRL